jgi:hypothetical protein
VHVYVPLVDMQVGRHVGSQAGRRGRPTHGLQGKVVHARLLHAHVPEVEALGAQRVCAEQGPRGWQVTTVAPGTRDWRRVHGGERRGHLHGSGSGSGCGCVVTGLAVALGNGCGNERLRAVDGGGRLHSVVTARDRPGPTTRIRGLEN